MDHEFKKILSPFMCCRFIKFIHKNIIYRLLYSQTKNNITLGRFNSKPRKINQIKN